MPDPTTLPQEIMSLGISSSRLLDVRPTLSKGEDPFSLIMTAVAALDEGEALHLLAPFDPLPLYAVLGGKGFHNYSVKEGEVHNIWFYRAVDVEKVATKSNTGELQGEVLLDVRGLEPPQPMAVILEKLHELGDGAHLLVDHHREPVMLYDKLAVMGFKAEAKEISAGHWQVRILPEWAGADER